MTNSANSTAAAEPLSWKVLLERFQTTAIAACALLCIITHLLMRYAWHMPSGISNWPLWITLVLGGIPLVGDLLAKVFRLQFGADLLGGISIIVSVMLGEYLAGAIIVLMLSGGEALESYALSNATSVLSSLAKRMPSIAHRQNGAEVEQIPLSEIRIGDHIVIYPHDVCPVDGTVVNGHSVMDESYLTGEPFLITKTTGSAVISGAVNGDSMLVIQSTHEASDSRYAKIMEVMHESEQTRPNLRRLGDQLGAWFTPVALLVAFVAWWFSGDATRFLSVLVIATPCPLLLAIPIAILGSISLCASRAIIVKSPVALEQIPQCRTAIFDKTGTLTYGEPTLTQQLVAPGLDPREVLSLVASLEQYSKHPLSRAIVEQADVEGLSKRAATQVSEAPGMGLTGIVDGQKILVTSRRKIGTMKMLGLENLSASGEGLECMVVINDTYAATYQMRDAPRSDSRAFVEHLEAHHHIDRVMILSGDRESEARYLADQVGISEVLAQQTPEQKLEIVRRETRRAKCLYVGDGINDAPAMMAASVGISIGTNSDVTAQAADVVVMDNTLQRVDEFLHVGRRMRQIALQSALGGMALSIIGMSLAAFGFLNPVSGAVAQEIIDVLAVLNALRAAWPPGKLSDI
ncbi:MAG: cadmium-translocating P-type ATPase [Planctomycetes bacterium]|nr:cadmium-translocating P-type ATPase [Planctomycetota bacterium]